MLFGVSYHLPISFHYLTLYIQTGRTENRLFAYNLVHFLLLNTFSVPFMLKMINLSWLSLQYPFFLKHIILTSDVADVADVKIKPEFSSWKRFASLCSKSSKILTSPGSVRRYISHLYERRQLPYMLDQIGCMNPSCGIQKVMEKYPKDVERKNEWTLLMTWLGRMKLCGS